MKIFLVTIFMFLTLALSLNAQNGSIIVTKVVGQVDYVKDQFSDKKRLIPGLKIPIVGTLHLPKHAIVNLLFNGKQIKLEEKGTYDVRTLAKQNDKGSSMSFASRFWDFINEGLLQTDDEDALNDYNERLLAVSGGVQGFALETSSVQTIMPTGGNIGTDLVTFNWRKVTNASAYHFKIFHVDQNELVFQAQVRDTSFTLDFSQLVFFPKETYKWKIEVEDLTSEPGEEVPFLASEIKTFQYLPKGEKAVLEKAKAMDDFQSADASEKQWMEAIIMEQEKFNYDAYFRYQKLLSENPDNLLIKKLFAAFLVRQDLTDEAIKKIH